MNWRGGFFRAWVVLSILWVISAGLFVSNFYFSDRLNFETYYSFSWEPPYANYLEPTDAQWQQFVEARTLPDGIVDHEFNTWNYRGHLYAADGILSEDLAKSSAFVQGEIDRYQADTDTNRQAFLPTALAIVLLPPLGLLLIGWVIGWVLVGFRKAA